MEKERRYCPLCDAQYQQRTCPYHNVPTLPMGDSAVPSSKIARGSVLAGRYRIDSLVGKGGMGAALAGKDLHEDRDVVIKVLRGTKAHKTSTIRRFYREGQAAVELRHPNIVRMFGLGFDEATSAPFLVMERVFGQTLESRIGQDGPFSESQAKALILQVARALQAAHAKGILHRDLKPQNIMLRSENDHVVVLDFGLAKALRDESTPALTAPGKSVGTPAYMSPEQIMQQEQTERSDLYGVGCLLHYTLVGKPPYQAKKAVEVMRMHILAPSPPLPPILADGQAPSVALSHLHRSLLAKEPHYRPENTQALVDGLKVTDFNQTMRAELNSSEGMETLLLDQNLTNDTLPEKPPKVDDEALEVVVESERPYEQRKPPERPYEQSKPPERPYEQSKPPAQRPFHLNNDDSASTIRLSSSTIPQDERPTPRLKMVATLVLIFLLALLSSRLLTLTI